MSARGDASRHMDAAQWYAERCPQNIGKADAQTIAAIATMHYVAAIAHLLDDLNKRVP